MSNEPKTILISRKPGTPCDDAVAFVYSIGGVPLEHDLGSVPAVDFETLSAALIVVVGQFEAAASQTNRWRVELGDRFRPIVWILDSDESVDGRPDACLVRPIDFALAAAQLRAFERIQIQVEGLRDRAGEVGALAEKLSLAHDLRRRDQSLAHATLHLAPTRPREIGSLRFGYFHELYPTGDPSLLDIATDGDRVRILVARVDGDGGWASCMNAMMARRLAAPGTVPPSSPGEVLRAINRELLKNPDLTPAKISILDIDCRSGTYRLAQAGMSDAVLVRTDGSIESIPFSDPHLGFYEVAGATREGQLLAGEQLVVGTDLNLAFVACPVQETTAQELVDLFQLMRPSIACAIAYLP